MPLFADRVTVNSRSAPSAAVASAIETVGGSSLSAMRTVAVSVSMDSAVMFPGTSE